MSYLDPKLVTSPKGAISDLEVLYDGKEQDVPIEGVESWQIGWSLAKLKWHGVEAHAMRWNAGTTVGAPLGNPQSRGIATWFVLPKNIGEVVYRQVTKQGKEVK